MPAETEKRYVALVVDDDPASLMMVSEALEAAGIDALVARDGPSALRLVARVRPDVILLDAVMPGLDGFELCRQLKMAPYRIEVPIVFMTGLSEPGHILQGLRAGGVDYVTKPLDLEELIARIGVHLLNARMLESARRALDSCGRAVAAFRSDGTMSWASPRAAELLSLRLPAVVPAVMIEEGRAVGSLLNWLRELRDTPLSQTRRLTVGHLEIAYLGPGTGDEVQLSIQDRSGRTREDLLAGRFGLTEREAQVLYWLTLGKTNTDIGHILGLSGRTVNKHLEQVFQKMGVENRTSAAVLADRVMGGH